MNLMEFLKNWRTILVQGDQTCEWDSRQGRNSRLAWVCGSQTMLFDDFLWGKAMEKPDKKWAESALFLQQPFLLSPHCNCALWEERIQGKSWNMGTWVGFLLLPNDYVAHLPDSSAFRLASRSNYSSLLKVFSIPYSMSWQLFPSQQLGQVFLLFSSLQMTTLLSQHARWPRLLGNRWHSSRRHFYFQEFHKSEYWLPKAEIFLNVFPSTFFPLFSAPHSFSHHAKHHTATTVTHISLSGEELWVSCLLLQKHITC